jgi:iron-sulfur cluster insertion protein
METTQSSELGLSDSASQQVSRLKIEKEQPQLMLRVFVQGGGCSGFQYGFQFDEEHDDDDLVIEHGEVTVVVDPLSFQYLEGAKIDYLDDLMGCRFVINNPNAATTCGCGSSFSI